MLKLPKHNCKALTDNRVFRQSPRPDHITTRSSLSSNFPAPFAVDLTQLAGDLSVGLIRKPMYYVSQPSPTQADLTFLKLGPNTLFIQGPNLTGRIGATYSSGLPLTYRRS